MPETTPYVAKYRQALWPRQAWVPLRRFTERIERWAKANNQNLDVRFVGVRGPWRHRYAIAIIRSAKGRGG